MEQPEQIYSFAPVRIPEPASEEYAPAPSFAGSPKGGNDIYAPAKSLSPESSIFFVPNLDRGGAEQKLKGAPGGSFVVRGGSSAGLNLVVSYVEHGTGRVQHIKVFPIGPKWTDQLGQQHFASVTDFLRSLSYNLLVDNNPAPQFMSSSSSASSSSKRPQSPNPLQRQQQTQPQRSLFSEQQQQFLNLQQQTPGAMNQNPVIVQSAYPAHFEGTLKKHQQQQQQQHQQHQQQQQQQQHQQQQPQPQQQSFLVCPGYANRMPDINSGASSPPSQISRAPPQSPPPSQPMHQGMSPPSASYTDPFTVNSLSKSNPVTDAQVWSTQTFGGPSAQLDGGPTDRGPPFGGPSSTTRPRPASRPQAPPPAMFGQTTQEEQMSTDPSSPLSIPHSGPPSAPPRGPPPSSPPSSPIPARGPPPPSSGPPRSGPPLPSSGPPRSGPPLPSSGPPRSGPSLPSSGPPRSGPPTPSGPPPSGAPSSGAPVSKPPSMPQSPEPVGSGAVYGLLTLKRRSLVANEEHAEEQKETGLSIADNEESQSHVVVNHHTKKAPVPNVDSNREIKPTKSEAVSSTASPPGKPVYSRVKSAGNPPANKGPYKKEGYIAVDEFAHSPKSEADGDTQSDPSLGVDDTNTVSSNQPTTKKNDDVESLVNPDDIQSKTLIDPSSFTIDSAIPVASRKKKLGAGKTFITFSISFLADGKTKTVLKRYSDFDTFYTTLTTQLLRKNALPALPPKRIFNNTESSFVEQRRIHLELWLRKIASMPSVAHHPSFAHFLDLKQVNLLKSAESTDHDGTAARDPNELMFASSEYSALPETSPPPPLSKAPGPPPPAPAVDGANLPPPPRASPPMTAPLKLNDGSASSPPPPPPPASFSAKTLGPGFAPPSRLPPAFATQPVADSSTVTAVATIRRGRARSRSVGSLDIPLSLPDRMSGPARPQRPPRPQGSSATLGRPRPHRPQQGQNLTSSGEPPAALLPPPPPLSLHASNPNRPTSPKLPPPLVKRSLSSGSLAPPSGLPTSAGRDTTAPPGVLSKAAKKASITVQYESLPAFADGGKKATAATKLCSCGEKVAARVEERGEIFWLCRSCAMCYISEGKKKGRSIVALNKPSKPQRPS